MDWVISMLHQLDVRATLNGIPIEEIQGYDECMYVMVCLPREQRRRCIRVMWELQGKGSEGLD